MATSEILVKPGTAVIWKDSGGTLAITTLNLSHQAGRVGAQHDKGAGAQEAWFNVHIAVQFDAAPVALEKVELYMLSHDGASVPGTVGVADADVTVANKRYNLGVVPIIVTAEAATADLTFENAGIVYLPMRYISPVVWNDSAAAHLANHANLSAIITMTPLVDEAQ
jgi:hypothetical protein